MLVRHVICEVLERAIAARADAMADAVLNLGDLAYSGPAAALYGVTVLSEAFDPVVPLGEPLSQHIAFPTKFLLLGLALGEDLTVPVAAEELDAVSAALSRLVERIRNPNGAFAPIAGTSVLHARPRVQSAGIGLA